MSLEEQRINKGVIRQRRKMYDGSLGRECIKKHGVGNSAKKKKKE